METLLGEKLKNAIDFKNSDLNSFIWKGYKQLDEDGKYKQSEKRLVDMSAEELSICYDHCKTMLFNNDPKNPGRYVVLKLIADQSNRCGAELFLRYLDQEKNITRFNLMNMLSTFLTENKDTFKEVKPVLSDAFSGLPSEYENLPLSLIMDSCLDRLGALNKKHITRTFILKQGIWLTPAESKELVVDDINTDRLLLIRTNLGLKDIENLYINSKGLNYTQMRAMLGLKPNKKYIDLTTVQLETLRYRILFTLEEEVKKHITSWENRMSQIEQVAEFKKYKL